MGKLKKEHRKKIAKRNEAIKQKQKKMQKEQEEFLKKIIEQEKAAGKFNNIPITDPNEIFGAPKPTFTDIKGPIL